MIEKTVLEELGISEEAADKVLEKLNENEQKENYKNLVKEEVEKLNPYSSEIILKLFNAEEAANTEELKNELVGFKNEYPFLFKNDEIPQLTGSTKTGRGVSAAEFKKMDYNKRSELYRKNPKLYKELANA